MPTKLSADDIFELSKAFHELFCALGKFRYENEMMPQQYSDLEGMQWTLFNMACDLNAKSALRKIDLLQDQLNKLKSCTEKMKMAVERINEIKRAIGIGAKAVAFAGAIYLAIYTGNVDALISAGDSLVNEIG